MSAANTDLVRNGAPNFATTLASPIVGSGDTSCSLSSVTGLPTGTAITITIDSTDSSGNPTPDVEETITGVISGSQLVDLLRGQDGTTAQAHSTGAIVVQWFTANDWNDFQSSYLTQHNQNGTHGAVTASSLTTSGNLAVTGTSLLTGAVTANSTLGVAGAATLASLVLNGSLTGTGLGSQVQSFSNAGTAGGTGYYINIGGIKLCWGISAQYLNAQGSQSFITVGVTLPTFFTTVQFATANLLEYGSTQYQMATVGATLRSGLTSALDITIVQTNGSNGTGYVSWFMIGT